MREAIVMAIAVGDGGAGCGHLEIGIMPRINVLKLLRSLVK